MQEITMRTCLVVASAELHDEQQDTLYSGLYYVIQHEHSCMFRVSLQGFNIQPNFNVRKRKGCCLQLPAAPPKPLRNVHRRALNAQFNFSLPARASLLR